MQEIKNIPNNSINLIVTSPPYNVGKDYGNYDDNKSEKDYYEFIDKVFFEIYRVLGEGGRICINIPVMGNNPTIKKQEKYVFYLNKYISLLEKNKLKLREVLTWVKAYTESDETFCGGNTAWGSWLSPSCPYCRSFTEFIIVCHKNNPKRICDGETDITKKEFLKYTRNVWFFPSESDRTHPAPFPEELPKRCIKLYSFVGDTIFDPFMGSGTTGVVALKLNRKFVGIEINSQFFKHAEKRIDKWQHQTKLSKTREGL